LERNLDSLAKRMGYAFYAENLAHSQGLLQGLDPRVKVAGIFALIVATALSRRLETILVLFAAALTLAILSHVPLGTLGKRIWIPALIFTGAISFPAIFVTPGKVAWRLPLLRWPVTVQGLTAAGFLISRVETSASLAILLVLCTPWSHTLKSLRAFGIPAIVTVILGMAYRYILLFLNTAHEMFECRQSRRVGRLDAGDRRRVAAANAGVLISQSAQLSEEVYLAMLSRGFRGEVRPWDDFRLRRRDWLAAGSVVALVVALCWR
jgi:cobalt/nickel transport system permease protein